jgi:hypothetical protein
MTNLYFWRRLRNIFVLGLSVGATVIGLGWLVLILGQVSAACRSRCSRDDPAARDSVAAEIIMPMTSQ